MSNFNLPPGTSSSDIDQAPRCPNCFSKNVEKDCKDFATDFDQCLDCGYRWNIEDVDE